MVKKEIHGFISTRSRVLPELHATLYEFSHEKSGAELIYLDREDENKTFAIGFATPPENNTGVFHIIEHSVLCGSEKYPLNDPFAELLKGSLNTFLNAATYPDRTVYPVSSRCEKDFLNLTDVYMDAVFHPNMLSNPSIFKQEGWRYEYDEETDTLSCNGVVYNEMKGVYSSPDELGNYYISSSLFSNTLYEYDSGGKPSDIPSLSYKEFCDTYKKYYHPSNAKIFLDGRMDLDKVLALLDSHLCRFERRDPTVVEYKSEKKISPAVTVSYEISENESEEGKARVILGYVFSDIFDKEGQLASAILSDLLCGSNAAPLKKAILDRGLAKDVAMYTQKSKENVLIIEVRDADETKLDEIDSIIKETVSKMVADGISKNMLHSTLNAIEFRIREKDYGALPMGVIYASSLYDYWIYGEKPEEALLVDETIISVRKMIDEGRFEAFLRSLILENNHCAKVIMLPDKTLSQRSEEEEKLKLKTKLASMTKAEIERVKEENQALNIWQNTPPTEEEEATLPSLNLDDIPKESSRPFAKSTELDGVKIQLCPVKTNGIVYISMLFDASDVANEELIDLSMLSCALMNFPTEKRDALSLQNDVKSNLGSLFASLVVGSKGNVAKPYLKIGAKSLTSKTDDMIRLIKELLLDSKIENSEEMKKLALQMRSTFEDAIISSGDSFAQSRTSASMSEEGAISEYLLGYEAYRLLTDICKNDEKISLLTKNVNRLLEKLIDRSRMTLLVTGLDEEKFLRDLISVIPEKNIPYEKKATALCAQKNEFLLLPTKVGYAVMRGQNEMVSEKLGLMRVARSILSYEYLWNTVRVQSGAYGTGFTPRKSGAFTFYSYRDPSPARSLEFYEGASDYLRALAEEGEDIEKFIIGAIGEYDTLITPRVAARICENDYLSDFNKEDEIKIRQEMLNMKTEDLLTVADIIDKALENKAVATVGSEEHLNALKDAPKRVIKI